MPATRCTFLGAAAVAPLAAGPFIFIRTAHAFCDATEAAARYKNEVETCWQYVNESNVKIDQ